jgi:hypothetical protein
MVIKVVALACLACLVMPRSVAGQAASGDVPVVVVAAFQTGNSHTTLDSVQQDMASRDFPTFWPRASFGVYRPFIHSVNGWYEVSADLGCGGYDERVNGVPRAAEHAALAAGVVFPPGSVPVIIVPNCGHVEKAYASSLPNTAYGKGIFTDGKLLNDVLGGILGLGVANAVNTPPNPVNNFDPFTPMGHTDFARTLSGWEQADAHIGWISGSQVLTGVATGTFYIEAMGQPPTGAIKLWRFPNFINIDVRQLEGTAVPLIHVSHSLLDLEATACNQYALPPGQTFAWFGMGYTNDGAMADGSGVLVSAFPYAGPSTVTCVGGPGSFPVKGGTPPPPPSGCTKNCGTPLPPPPCTKTCGHE